jgi:hypothetical protein
VDSNEHPADHSVRLINSKRVPSSCICRIREGQQSVDRVASWDVLLCGLEEVLKQQVLTVVERGRFQASVA